MKQRFTILLLVVLSGCSQKKDTEIDVSDSFKNRKHYVVSVQDTITIYRFYYGIDLYTQIDTTNLSKAKYLYTKTVHQEEDCYGCTTVSADRFLAIEKGIDTIFYPYFSHFDEYLIDRDTFYVFVK